MRKQVFDSVEGGVNGPIAGRLRQTRTAARFDKTEPSLDRGAPRLGEHNGEILTELDFSAAEIEELRRSGAVGTETYEPTTSSRSVDEERPDD